MLPHYRWVLVLGLFGGIAAATRAQDVLPAGAETAPPGEWATSHEAPVPAPGGPVPMPGPVGPPPVPFSPGPLLDPEALPPYKAGPGPVPDGVPLADGHPYPGAIPPNQVSLLFPALKGPLFHPGPGAPGPIEPLPPADGDGCGPFWVSGEYLLLWMRNAPNPVLLQTPSSAPNMTPPQALYGGSNVNFNAFSGFRLALGVALTDCCGVELTGFVTGQGNTTFGINSAGSPVLQEPFVAVSPTSAVSTSATIAAPGVLAGAFSAHNTEQFGGAELNFLGGAVQRSASGTTLIAGLAYRALNGEEDLATQSSPLGANVVHFRGTTFGAPATLSIQDRFQAYNWFIGGQLGAGQRWYWGSFFLDARGTVAIGSTQMQTTINGLTTLFTGPTLTPVATTQGGLYAQPTNIGRVEQARFTYLPTVDLKFGWCLTSRLVATIGYNGTYWSSVARPGDQINQAITVSQVPSLATFGPTLAPNVFPQHHVVATDFWAQGLTAGLEIRF